MNNVRDITTDGANINLTFGTFGSDRAVTQQSGEQDARPPKADNSQEKVNEAAEAASQKNKKVDEKKVKQLTDDLNGKMAAMNIQLQFIWHKEIERMSVSMIDMNTMKTIRSFPPEDLIKELVRAKEWTGRFLDKKA